MTSLLLTATKEYSWDMAHMLDEHLGLCKNLHGHTYKMQVTVASNDSDQRVQTEGPAKGMVVDFKELKQVVQEQIVGPLDHCTIINSNSKDPFENALNHLLIKHNKKRVCVPYRPTAENMAWDFMTTLNAELRARRVPYIIVKLRLYETPTSFAEINM